MRTANSSERNGTRAAERATRSSGSRARPKAGWASCGSQARYARERRAEIVAERAESRVPRRLPGDDDHVDSVPRKAHRFQRGPNAAAHPVALDRGAETLGGNDPDLRAIQPPAATADSSELGIPREPIVRAHAGGFGV